MRKVLVYVQLVFLCIISLSSCEKENVENNNNEFIEARIFDGGDEAVDGCGWLIYVDSVYYHPVNLPGEFEKDGLEVEIKYRKDSFNYICGDAMSPMSSIFLEEIVVPEVLISDYNNLPEIGDQFSIDTAYLYGDFLFMRVGYSGGCNDHDFSMYVLPPNPDLMLHHNGHDDFCDAFLMTYLCYDLKPLQDPDKNSITFNLRRSPEMSSYYGTFTYDY